MIGVPTLPSPSEDAAIEINGKSLVGLGTVLKNMVNTVQLGWYVDCMVFKPRSVNVDLLQPLFWGLRLQDHTN